MAAFAVASRLGRTPLIASGRCGNTSVFATASVLLIAFGFTVLCLGTASEALAATGQIWGLTVQGNIGARPGNPGVPIPPTTIPLNVSSTGAISPQTVLIPPIQTCEQGGAVTVGGTFDTALRLSVSGTACGASFSVNATGQLDAPFPNATRTVGSLSAIGQGVDVRADATCLDCPSPPLQVTQAIAGAKQAAALGTVALTTTSVQTTNIGLRLGALRSGASGANLSGLALSIDRQPLPLGAVIGLIGPPERSGGASADRSSLLSKLGVFANGQGSFGDQSATSNEPGFEFHTAGITLGADYRLTDKLLLGAAFGYLRTKSDFDASAGDSTVNGYSLSAYGNYYILDKLYVDGIATFGWNDYDTERNIAPAGATAAGSTDGTQFAISVSTGYDFTVGGFTFGPTGRVNYVRVHIDGYNERGADPFNLSIGSQTIESVTTALGGQAAYAISTRWGVLSPLVRFEWEHEYKANSRTVTASVLADPATVVAVQTSSPDRDYFNVGTGFSATFKGGVSAFFFYNAVLGRANFTNHAFTGGVRLEF